MCCASWLLLVWQVYFLNISQFLHIFSIYIGRRRRWNCNIERATWIDSFISIFCSIHSWSHLIVLAKRLIPFCFHDRYCSIRTEFQPAFGNPIDLSLRTLLNENDVNSSNTVHFTAQRALFSWLPHTLCFDLTQLKSVDEFLDVKTK